MFRYRLHSPDWDDLGEAVYAVMIKSGEEILAPHNPGTPANKRGRATTARAGRRGSDPPPGVEP